MYSLVKISTQDDQSSTYITKMQYMNGQESNTFDKIYIYNTNYF